ncbi:hypothetical protein LZ30DRAFT_725865 [Colletotrichum cereale]|nr:hypothetical protein LZ30DRAFT_725865 [Colletotrichum cereale]
MTSVPLWRVSFTCLLLRRAEHVVTCSLESSCSLSASTHTERVLVDPPRPKSRRQTAFAQGSAPVSLFFFFSPTLLPFPLLIPFI